VIAIKTKQSQSIHHDMLYKAITTQAILLCFIICLFQL